jgi:hypothetical protein
MVPPLRSPCDASVSVGAQETLALDGGCRVNVRKSTARRVLGRISEISAQMRLLSYQTEVCGTAGMVVSHDLLMHRSSERFVRQPRRVASAYTEQPAQLHRVEITSLAATRHRLFAVSQRPPPTTPR